MIIYCCCYYFLNRFWKYRSILAEFLFVFATAWRNFSQSFHNRLRVNITIARRQDIVSRGEACDDGDIVNPWRWEWCDKTANDRRLGEFIRKLRKKGVSWCSVCVTRSWVTQVVDLRLWRLTWTERNTIIKGSSVPEGPKWLNFKAIFQNFPGGACPRTPLGESRAFGARLRAFGSLAGIFRLFLVWPFSAL